MRTFTFKLGSLAVCICAADVHELQESKSPGRARRGCRSPVAGAKSARKSIKGVHDEKS